MSLTPFSPCGCPHTIDIKYTSLSRNSKHNDLMGLKLKFNYNIHVIVIYLRLLFVILLIYIDEKFILVQKTWTSLHEKKTVWHQWALIVCVELTPQSTCVNLSLTPFHSCGHHKWMAPYSKKSAAGLLKSPQFYFQPNERIVIMVTCLLW